MNYYELIREIRNKLEAPKLEECCDVLIKTHNLPNDIFLGEDKIHRVLYIEEVIHDVRDGEVVVFSDDRVCFKDYCVFVKDMPTDKYVILGKPVSLQEIMIMLETECLDKKNIDVNYMVSEKTFLGRTIVLGIETGDSIDDENYSLIELDLTKEIKDQDCLKEIYELIK